MMKAIGSNREVNLNAIGRPAVLIFHTAETAEDAQRINQAVRGTQEYKSFESVLIANVVDLHSVPKLFRSFAEKSMRDSYVKAGGSLPQGETPQDYVIILPDWDGTVTKAFGLKDTNKMASAVILDASGNIVGVYQSGDLTSQALQQLSVQA